MPDINFFKQSITAFEGFAAIAGILCWAKWKNSFWKWFIVYLTILFLSESAGQILSARKMYAANGILYGWFVLPMEFLFFCWLYYQFFEQRIKPLAIFCAAAYLVSWIIEQLFIKERSAYFSSFSYCMGNLVLVIMVVVFMARLLFSDSMPGYKTNPAFWVSIGVMIFYLGTFPYYGLFHLLATKKFRPIHEMYTWVMIFLNYAMYSIFAGVFIWSKPK